MTMRAALLALTLLAAAVPAAQAKNYAVPEKNPAATVTIPDNWETDEIEYGYGAFSPGKDVYFSIETADAGSVDKLMKSNQDWMKSSNIKPKGAPEVSQRTFNGLSGNVYHFDATDEGGPTNVDFAVLPIPNNRIVFLTFWASNEEYDKHKAAFDGIIASLKPIK